MSKTNFTEGPWAVIKPSNRHGYYIEDNMGYTIADLYYMPKDFSTSVSHRNPGANAYLIACAPEMYEFLESLQLDVTNDYKRDELLAKARGEK